MQAVYSTYNTTGRGLEGKTTHFKKGGYLERSEKRSPYDTYEITRKRSGGGKDSKKKGDSPLYIIFTVLLLIVLYPVGLILLWQKKLSWPVGTKILMSIMTAILFCALLIVGMNYDTGNETISAFQKKVRNVFERVDYYTGDSVDAVKDWFVSGYEKGRDNAVQLWETIDESVAQSVLTYYGKVDENLYAVKVALPQMLLDLYKDRIDYQEKPTAPDAPEKLATPDSGMNVVINTPSSAEGSLAPRETPRPTQTPAPVATATPAPTATPEPITLPEIKNVAYAEVFFTKGGVYYHIKPNCSGMMNSSSRTLLEAQQNGKKYCDVCGVPAFEMMDCENYLWVDPSNVAHTTDECRDFAEGKYEVLPFDDVYNGSYRYCESCNADVCLLYMQQNDRIYLANGEILDDQMKELYDYERTIIVYYGENSRQYHSVPECQHMHKETYRHTLYQALHVDMKKVCPLCSPLTEEQAYEQLNSMKSES